MSKSKKTDAPVARGPFFLFFFSGAAALGYQVVWVRQFSALLGHEFSSALAIVTAFMCGMGLGALTFSRAGEGRSRSARWFGILEIAIGVWAIATTFLGPGLMDWTREIIGFSPSVFRQTTLSFLAVLFLVLPATAAMGATLPAASFLFPPERTQKFISALYAANTAGAMSGALGTAFFLMPLLGLSNAVFVLALVNIACGVLALKIASAVPTSSSLSPSKTAVPVFILFMTGLLGIAYEIVAIRLLSNVLENTLYTFASVLAVFLFGTSAGAFVHKRQMQSGKVTEGSIVLSMLGFAVVLCGIAALATPGFYALLRKFFGDSTLSVLFCEALTSGLVLLLPSFLMGWVFAHFASISAHGGGLSKAVAANSFGAMFAPLVFGTTLISLLGTKLTLVAIGFVYLLLANRKKLLVLTVPLLLALAYFSPGRITPVELSQGEKLIFFREGAMAAVSVIENTNDHRVLKVNNRFQMGGTAARIAELRHADIPLLLHPDPKEALFLGLGTGITFSAAEEFGGLIADGVELLPSVVEAIPLFSESSGDNFAPPGKVFHVADARRFVRMSPKQYDVIVADLFHPAQDGAGFLYTLEHFQAVRDRLKSGGLFCQWLPLYQLDRAGFDVITRTFLEVFPHASLWLLRPGIETPVVGLIGMTDERTFTADLVERRLLEPALEHHLKRVALSDSIRLFGCFMAEASTLKNLTAHAPISTDDRPLILFQAPQFTYKRNIKPYARQTELLRELPSSSRGIFPPGDPVAGRVDSYIAARNIYLEGMVMEAEGKVAEGIAAYLRSAKISADFTLGYAQCITIATALLKANPDAAKEMLLRLDEAQPERPVARQMLGRFFPGQPQTTESSSLE